MAKLTTLAHGTVQSPLRRMFGKLCEIAMGAVRSIDEDIAFGGGWGVKVIPRDPSRDRRKTPR